MERILVPAWPEAARQFQKYTPRTSPFDPFPGMSPQERADAYLSYRARRLQRLDPRMTGITGTYNECIYANRSDFTAYASSSSEGSLLVNTPDYLPYIPANHFLSSGSAGRSIVILASGILGTTSTPTITFQVRFGETAGAAYLSGSSVGVSAAITTSSGVSNKWWQLRLDLICTVQGTGTNKGTVSGAGYVMSPGGFASPFIYALEPTTPDTATWTQTFNPGVTNYINVSATWSASSASNTATCKQLKVYAEG